jgi:hypothetical protein
MFTELNASGYGYNGIFYNTEFEDILSKIIACYHLMLSDNVTLSNDENQIRDVLYLNYLNSDKIRKSVGLLSYYFDRETQEDRTSGRTDIRILTANSFIETAAYYIIECKRLDATNPNGTTGLNAEYIKNGICRFVSQTYSSHYKTNGMIGFIVEPINIDTNVVAINNLLKNNFSVANTIQPLTHREIVTAFSFTYYSTHNTGKDRVLLYHLMFNFSKNIKS